MIFDLVEWIAAAESLNKIPLSNFYAFAATLKYAGLGRIRGYERMISNLRSMPAKGTIPRLSTLLNLSALNAVHPIDILIRPREVSSAPLFDLAKNFSELPFGTRPNRERTSIVAQCLSDERLLDCEYLPAAIDIMKFFQLKPSALSELFPDVMSVYRAYRGKKCGKLSAPSVHRSFVSSLHHLKGMEFRLPVCLDVPPELIAEVSGKVNVSKAVAAATLRAAAVCIEHARHMPQSRRNALPLAAAPELMSMLSKNPLPPAT